MSEIAEFADEVLAQFSSTITDQVFLLIQNDKELMHRYLRLVEESGLDTVNKVIGKKVKSKFNLVNRPEREDSPQSTLIQSHQIFE